jgi:hypothetical protein
MTRRELYGRLRALGLTSVRAWVGACHLAAYDLCDETAVALTWRNLRSMTDWQVGQLYALIRAR